MTYTRLPESVQALYSELLDQVRSADAEAALDGVSGTFVSKAIRGRTYWYVQQSRGASKRQIYLGVETPDLLARMNDATARTDARRSDERRRAELVSMLESGGVYRESAAIGTVLRVLADASVFRAGGVLVGTQAFTCVANLLGVTFEHATQRTFDVDFAHDTAVPLGIAEPPDLTLLDRLKASNPAFFAVPGFDPREASTSFKVRGRDLRIDVLTPGVEGGKPVALPHLGISAQPLPGLDYIIEGAIDAVAVVGAGVHVNVPTPARFALHKLWVSAQRSTADSAKSRKDVRQAERILDVLLDDRPRDVELAWAAVARRRGFATAIRRAIRQVDPAVRPRLNRVLQ